MLVVTMIKDCRLLPIYLNIPLHIIVCSVAFISDILLYKYFGSLPDFKKSILTYTVRMMAFTSCISVLWFNIAAVTLEFSGYFNEWIWEYPNLFCSLSRAETMSEVIMTAVIMVQLCKACIVFNSLSFLNMDHEKVFRFMACTALAIFIIQNSLEVFFIGTLCPATKMKKLSKVHGIKVPAEAVKEAPPIFYIYFLITFLSTLLLKLVKKIKNRNKNVNPVKRPDQTNNFPSAVPPPRQDYNVFIIKQETRKIKLDKVDPYPSSSHVTLDLESETDASLHVNEINETNNESVLDASKLSNKHSKTFNDIQAWTSETSNENSG